MNIYEIIAVSFLVGAASGYAINFYRSWKFQVLQAEYVALMEILEIDKEVILEQLLIMDFKLLKKTNKKARKQIHIFDLHSYH